MDVSAIYTLKGLELKAKMETGVPLKITRIVAGAGRDGDLITLESIADIRQELGITGILQRGTQASIFALLSNKGLATGYDLTRIGILANDPDEGEILYRVAELKQAFPISAEKDFPNFAIDCTFTDTISNASSVNVIVDPAGTATASQFEVVKTLALKALNAAQGGGGIILSPTRPEGDWSIWLEDLGEAPDIDGEVVEEVFTADTAPIDAPGDYAIEEADGQGETLLNMTDNPETAGEEDIIVDEG